MARDLRHGEVHQAIFAWWYWTGSTAPLDEASLGWLRAIWEGGDDHLPLHLVNDLGHLLLSGRDFGFASARRLADWPEEERSARLRYEDRLLGRWAIDPTVIEAHVTIAGLPAAARDAAIAHAVKLALGRPLRASPEPRRGNPAYLRSATPKVPETFAALAEIVDPEWAAWAGAELASSVELLAEPRLYSAEDLWEIAHLGSLPSDSARLALRQIHRAAGLIGPIDPSVLHQARQRAREVIVQGESKEQYPTGGFDALSTRGSFENLLRTEVAYVGEGIGDEGGPDLFDLRFVEGELLYYTRDESPLLDARRNLTLVIHRPSELRHKPAQLPFETLVLIEGLVLAVHGDLLRAFGAGGGSVQIVWWVRGEEDARVAEEERALFALTLAAEIAHGRVTLHVASDLERVPERGRAVFSPEVPRSEVKATWWIQVGGETWRMGKETTFALIRGVAVLRPLADRLLGPGA